MCPAARERFACLVLTEPIAARQYPAHDNLYWMVLVPKAHKDA
jgi:hypothetical protein